MANSINWGKIYCFTEFGNEDNTIKESVPSFSAPSCFVSPISGDQIETLALTVDDTVYKVDSNKLKVDQTLI